MQLSTFPRSLRTVRRSWALNFSVFFLFLSWYWVWDPHLNALIPEYKKSWQPILYWVDRYKFKHLCSEIISNEDHLVPNKLDFKFRGSKVSFCCFFGNFASPSFSQHTSSIIFVVGASEENCKISLITIGLLACSGVAKLTCLCFWCPPDTTVSCGTV